MCVLDFLTMQVIVSAVEQTVSALIGRTGGAVISMAALVTPISDHAVYPCTLPASSVLHAALTADQKNSKTMSTGRHLLCGAGD